MQRKAPRFDVHDLYPGSTDNQIADDLASYFNAISSEFSGITNDRIPVTDPVFLPFFSETKVVNRLRKFRKPKSMVQGDIFSKIVNDVAPALSIPLTHIFNSITISQCRPSSWKVEYVTPIPKKAVPETTNDLRNISCTQLFSKLYERVA